MSDEPDRAASVAAESAAVPPSSRPNRRALEVWMLGALSVVGIIGFLVTFVLIVTHGSDSHTAVSRAAARVSQQGPAGERGPAGPMGPAGARGPQGPAGDAGIRVIRPECPTGTCTLECGDDEILLMAHCGTGRLPSVYQNERTALCRSSVRARADVVAACVKAARKQ